MRLLISLFTVSLFAAGLAGCDKLADCASICNRYKDCADSDYDAAKCTETCHDKAEDDSKFADRADQCEACIDDRSCTESFPCIDECIGIVP